MIRKVLIVFLSLALGHAACIAGVWQNAANASMAAPATMSFSSVAPMQTAGSTDLFHSSSFSHSRVASGHNYNSVTMQTLSLSARNLGNGTTADETLAMNRPRHVIIERDDDYDPEDGEGPLTPGYDPNDPFFTPVGDVPVLLLILLAALVTFFRTRKLKATQVAPVARETQEAITA